MVRTPAAAPGILNVIVSGPCRPFASSIACRNDPAPLSFVLVTTNVDGPSPTATVVVVAELLVSSGSLPVAVTEAVLPSDPAAFGVTTMLIETFAGLLIVPIVQVTVMVVVPDGAQDPMDALADTKVTPAGSTSVTTTLLAASGPVFDTAIRYVRGEPTVTGSGESVFVMARFAEPAVASTCSQVENSDVLPLASVIVAVMNEPGGTRDDWKLASRLALLPFPVPDDTPISV